MQTKKHDHAVVIGGSIAGLLTARALTDYFKQVTIVERDSLPDGAEMRNGTPQSKHPHNLLASGLDIMEKLFPGFEDDLVKHGAKHMNWGTQTRVLAGNNWVRSIETEIGTKVASRVLIEWCIRKRMMARDDVIFIQQAEVTGLLATPDKTKITGVSIKARVGQRDESDILADFVVDASGRGSKAGNWLQSLGYDAPQVTVVDAEMGYATRLYKKPDSFDANWRVLYMPAKAPRKRGGMIFEVENDTWMVSLGGFNGDYPDTDPESWLAYAQTLPSLELYDVIKDAEPLTDVIGNRRTKNYVNHYEKMSRFPSRFALVGDSVSAFNPVYGQGMTSAAIGADLLGEVLNNTDSFDTVGQKFQKKLAKRIEPIWLISTGNDLQFEGTIGDRPDWISRQVQKYIDVYLEVMIDDPVMIETFFKVQNLMILPTALLHPSMMLRTFVGVIKRQWSRNDSVEQNKAFITQ